MFDIAYAQGAPGVGGPGPMLTIFPFILIFAIMYFMVIRPQSQERKKLEKKISELKKGDKVLTTSGMFATVVSVEADRAVLKISDETKVEFAKSAIAQVLTVEGK